MPASTRLIPKYKPQTFGVAGCSSLLVAGCVGLYFLWIYPLLSLFALVIVVGLFLYERISARWYFKRLLGQRFGESFHTFSCEQDLISQNLTDVDIFIVRTVYEEVQLSLPIGKFPLRLSDNLYSDLRLEVDDLEDLIERVAQKTGRCIKHTALNPLFGKIDKIGDLIAFFHYQPILKAPID